MFTKQNITCKHIATKLLAAVTCVAGMILANQTAFAIDPGEDLVIEKTTQGYRIGLGTYNSFGPWALQASSDFSSWTTIGYLYEKAVLDSQYVVDTNSLQLPWRFYRAYCCISNDIHTVNSVGYINIVITNDSPTNLVLICNPFNHYVNGTIDNSLTTLMPAPPENSYVFIWDPSRQLYAVSTYEIDDYGLYTWDYNGYLNPGSGFYFLSGSLNTTLSFYGSLPTDTTVPLGSGLQIVSPLLPRSGYISTDLGYPIQNGDHVYAMPNHNLIEYQYTNGTWSPSEPYISVGQAFWSDKTTEDNWIQNISVW